MVKDINLTSREWCDLIFRDKNKDYGAYELRKTSSRRHINAMIIVVLLGVFFTLSPISRNPAFFKQKIGTLNNT
jgi:protein TonB